jgi:hypothetical protein
MSEDKEFSKLAPVERCPVCDGQLERGYIHSHIYWDTVRHKYLVGPWHTKEIILSPYSWTVPMHLP